MEAEIIENLEPTEDLIKILKDHKKWLKTERNNASFLKAHLPYENLSNINFGKVNLSCANLSGANLNCSNLSFAKLKDTNLSYASLNFTNFSKANLSYANLRYANLSNANLNGANLRHTDLFGANFCNSNLQNTVLDPCNTPNAKGNFEKEEQYVIGYRTRTAGHIDMYRDGRIYSADVFSTCKFTECHPGLYLWPDLKEGISSSPIVSFQQSREYIKVKTYQADIHQAGTKYRCRWFQVIGSVNIEEIYKENKNE